jgi:hypothetical protein
MGEADDSMARLALAFLAMTVMLALTVLGMRAADRFLGPKDPRRAIVTRAILWIGTAVLIVILLQLRK